MDLTEFEDLWTSPPGTYALVRVEGEGREGPGLLPLDLEAKAAVMVDVDDPLYAGVVQRMIDAGVPVLDREPWSSPPR